jgi:hypothetical protein
MNRRITLFAVAAVAGFLSTLAVKSHADTNRMSTYIFMQYLHESIFEPDDIQNWAHQMEEKLIEHFKLMGVSFPDGSDVFYDPHSYFVCIRNTPENIDIAKRMTSTYNVRPTQVEFLFYIASGSVTSDTPLIGAISRSGVNVFTSSAHRSADVVIETELSLTPTIGPDNYSIDVTYALNTKTHAASDTKIKTPIQELSLTNSIVLHDGVTLEVPLGGSDAHSFQVLKVLARIIDPEGLPIRPRTVEPNTEMK